MFENIGEKLKRLAYFLCWGGIIISVVSGILFIRADMMLVGVLTMVIGSLYFWISSWMTYAIGEIAENTNINRRAYSQTSVKPYYFKEEVSKNRIESDFKPSVANYYSSQRRCPHCGETVKSSICEMCGKKNNLFR